MGVRARLGIMAIGLEGQVTTRLLSVSTTREVNNYSSLSSRAFVAIIK